MATKRTDPAMQARALELHLAGVSYQKIADVVGFGSKGAAFRCVQEALSQAPTSTTERMTSELARLDAMLSGLWPKARRGDVRSVETVLRIEERRALLQQATAKAADAEKPKETGLSDFERRLRERESGTARSHRTESG